MSLHFESTLNNEQNIPNNENILKNNQKPIEKKQNINIENKISGSAIRSNFKEGTKREMISPITKSKPKSKSKK